MEYAMQVLNRHGPVSGQPARRKRFVDEVVCAYCAGRGADPKYSSASGCPVCRGAGRPKKTVDGHPRQVMVRVARTVPLP